MYFDDVLIVQNVVEVDVLAVGHPVPTNACGFDVMLVPAIDLAGQLVNVTAGRKDERLIEVGFPTRRGCEECSSGPV